MAWFSMAVQPSSSSLLLTTALSAHPHIGKKKIPPCDQMGRPLRKDQYLHIYYSYTQCCTCFIKISIWIICKVNTVTVLENSFSLELKLNAASVLLSMPPPVWTHWAGQGEGVMESRIGPSVFRDGGLLCGVERGKKRSMLITWRQIFQVNHLLQMLWIPALL